MEEQTTEIYQTAQLAVQEAVNALTTYGLDLVGAVIILIIGMWLANKVQRVTVRGLEKAKKVEVTLIGFFGSIAKYLILIFTGLAVLNQFGVQTTSLIAVLGAAGLAVGLALQGTLSNVAAGVMLLIFRPFKVGDYVEAGGHAGTIKELNLFVTELATPDNVQIIVPNGQVWGSPVTNYSAHPTRRVDLVMGIAYEDDIDKAMAVMHEVVGEEIRALEDPAPLVAVSELADSSVNFVVRVWVNSGDYWGVKFDLTKAMKQRFDEKGINIPFPCQTVYHVNAPK